MKVVRGHHASINTFVTAMFQGAATTKSAVC
jgi:hypothetical protein